MNTNETEKSPLTASPAPMQRLGRVRLSSAYNAANLDVCKCIGAMSYIEKIEKRLKSTKNPPLWIISDLGEAHRRMQALLDPLVKLRDRIGLHP